MDSWCCEIRTETDYNWWFNLFPFLLQTDLCGIKWRKLVCGDYNFSSEPLDDPVLASFSRCLAGDILCVWRRVATQQPASASGSHAANQGAGGLFDPIGLPPGLGGPGPQHPPLSLHAAKELWIFWYGEEPDLSGLVSPELIAAGEFYTIYLPAITDASQMLQCCGCQSSGMDQDYPGNALWFTKCGIFKIV